MAVNFDTLDGVSNIATRGQHAFNIMTGINHLDTHNLVQQVIDHLEQKIQELNKIEDKFLDVFQCGSLSEFERRVATYYSQNNLIAFTGANLKTIINDFKAELDIQDAELQKRFEQLFQAFLDGYIQGPLTEEWVRLLQGEEVTQAVVQEVISEFAHMLNSIKGGGGLRFEAQTRRFSSGNNMKAALSLVASRGTKAFKSYLNEVYDKALSGIQLQYTSRKGEKRNLQLKTNSHVTERQAIVSFAVKLSDIIRSSGTKMLTKSELEEKIKKGEISPRDISNKNREIINLICKELRVDDIYKKFIQNRIGSMLTTDPYMFFVGNSFTNLEGVLGEVNAVIAITGLLGDRFTDKALRWIGSQTGAKSGKQPSIDIVIDNLLSGVEKAEFGLQVKNTVDDLDTDLSHYINFADKSVTEILDKTGIGSEDIENVYISNAYNVPYKRLGNRYVQVGYGTTFEHRDGSAMKFRVYTTIDKLIDELVDSINTYLSQFAADFIYMANPDFKDALATLDREITGTTQGNFAYIIGSKVYFANKMLQELQTQLMLLKSLKTEEEQASLQFSTYFKKQGEKGGSGFNIVTAKNGKGVLSDYTIRMKSSWGFS